MLGANEVKKHTAPRSGKSNRDSKTSSEQAAALLVDSLTLVNALAKRQRKIQTASRTLRGSSSFSPLGPWEASACTANAGASPLLSCVARNHQRRASKTPVDTGEPLFGEGHCDSGVTRLYPLPCCCCCCLGTRLGHSSLRTGHGMNPVSRLRGGPRSSVLVGFLTPTHLSYRSTV